MQLSRHWRLNSQRYRLQGVRFANGKVYPYARMVPIGETDQEPIKKIPDNKLPKAS